MKSSSVCQTKNVALLVAVALLSPALMPHSAQAADSKKEKTLKTGAAVLGAVGAYYVAKGKTLKGVLAGAAGYYAYKKSKDADNDRSAGDIYPDEVYTRNDDYRNDDYRNDDYRDGDSGYVYPDGGNYDVINDDVINDDVLSDDAYYADGDVVTSREERRAQRREDRLERREDRVNRSERYSDDPGYISLNNDSAKTSTQGTVLK